MKLSRNYAMPVRTLRIYRRIRKIIIRQTTRAAYIERQFFFPLFFLVRDKKSKSMRNETESEKIT